MRERCPNERISLAPSQRWLRRSSGLLRVAITKRPLHMHQLIDRLASRTTLPHFAVSLVRNLPNDSGVSTIGEPPSFLIDSMTFGSLRPSLIVLLRKATTSFGVPFGAEIPKNALAS